jgi:nucleoside-diphosphate-sugar epimerase
VSASGRDAVKADVCSRLTVARYLVTGGAGFLGINLVRWLLERDQEVTSLDVAPFDYPERDRIRVVDGDIRRPADVARAIEDATVVVHAAAALPLYSPADIRSTDVDGTGVVVDAALAAGVDRLIHVSSTAVYGVPDHHPLVEDDRMHGVGPYGEAKVLAEGVVAAARARGLVAPILRPKSFIGPERLGVFAMLYEWADEGHHFPILGTGKNRYQLLDVEDLCQAIWLAATGEPAAVDDVFNIGAAVYTTLGQDFQAVLDAAGHGKRIIPIPAAPAVWILRALERLGLSPLYQWVYETVATDSYVSIERAVTRLGFAPRYSNRDALLRNFAWYRANKHRFGAAAGVSHRVPWKQGALALAKRIF